MGYRLPAAATVAYGFEFETTRVQGGRYEHFPEGGRWSDCCGGSTCINGRLHQQFEVADDDIIGVGHVDEPQLGSEFGATPIRRLHQTADPSQRSQRARRIHKPSPITQNPNGNAGVETTFSNEDGSNVIHDTILVMNDPSAAASALDSAKAKLGDSVKGTPGPANVGTGGTTASGNSPDGSKGVTMVLFTEGKVFATLEFDGPADIAGSTGFRHRRRPEARHCHQERTPRLTRQQHRQHQRMKKPARCVRAGFFV